MAKDLIDMGSELQDLLEEYGRQVFIRQSTGQRCSCWDSVTKEGSRECPRCSGFGWGYVDRKIWTFRTITTSGSGGAYRKLQTPMGATISDEASFWCEQNTQAVNASEHDWILECITKSNGCLWAPYKIQRVWDINAVHDYRDLDGEFAFYLLKCRRLIFGK
jgi:hypothetical protein